MPDDFETLVMALVNECRVKKNEEWPSYRYCQELRPEEQLAIRAVLEEYHAVVAERNILRGRIKVADVHLRTAQAINREWKRWKLAYNESLDYRTAMAVKYASALADNDRQKHVIGRLVQMFQEDRATMAQEFDTRSGDGELEHGAEQLAELGLTWDDAIEDGTE
jgi:hypothetical protein